MKATFLSRLTPLHFKSRPRLKPRESSRREEFQNAARRSSPGRLEKLSAGGPPPRQLQKWARGERHFAIMAYALVIGATADVGHRRPGLQRLELARHGMANIGSIDRLVVRQAEGVEETHGDMPAVLRLSTGHHAHDMTRCLQGPAWKRWRNGGRQRMDGRRWRSAASQHREHARQEWLHNVVGIAERAHPAPSTTRLATCPSIILLRGMPGVGWST